MFHPLFGIDNKVLKHHKDAIGEPCLRRLQGSQTLKRKVSMASLFDTIANFQGTQNQYKICKVSNRLWTLIFSKVSNGRNILQVSNVEYNYNKNVRLSTLMVENLFCCPYIKYICYIVYIFYILFHCSISVKTAVTVDSSNIFSSSSYCLIIFCCFLSISSHSLSVYSSLL